MPFALFCRTCNRFPRHVRTQYGGVQNGGNGNARGPTHQAVRDQRQRRAGSNRTFQLGTQVDREDVKRVGRRRNRIADSHVQQVHRDDPVADGQFRLVHVLATPAVPQEPSEAADTSVGK